MPIPPGDARPSLLVMETGLTIIVCAAAFCWPDARIGRLSRLTRGVQALANNRVLSIAVVMALVAVVRLSILPWIPIPFPFVHDEFSYLLAGDTFASGRLTNPTHPLWQHFESFHIDQKPTYMSMYFPAQGLFLAVGRLISGNPWFGVLLSSAMMAGAFCWMLQGWVPKRWALLGAMLAALRLAIFSYWANSYYGGAVSALGGALVLGALPRLIRKWRMGDGLAFAVGAALLANSRAYEGFLLCAPALTILLWRVRRKPLKALLPPMLPALAVLLAGFSFLGYYDYKVFGRPVTLPYEVNRTTYAVAPVFLWLKPRPEPAYRHAVMRDFYINWELRDFNKARSVSGFLWTTLKKGIVFALFFFGICFVPVLAFLPAALRDRRMRLLLPIMCFYAVGLSLNAWFFPHYAGPISAAIVLLTVQAMRHMRQWRLGGMRIGAQMFGAILALSLVLAILRVFAGPLAIKIDRFPWMWYGNEPLGLDRAAIEAELSRYSGPQLAIVRYSASHSSLDEWVYNKADIEGSRVVWAREMDPASNACLLDYFKDRRAWLVEPDAHPPALSQYPSALLGPEPARSRPPGCAQPK